MVKGKCLEDFIEWLKKKSEEDKKLGEIAFILSTQNYNVFDLPLSLLYGLLVDFFDEHGIYIDSITEYQYTREEYEDGDDWINPHYVPESWWSDIHDNSRQRGVCTGRSRSEARQKALSKAVEIYNQTK